MNRIFSASIFLPICIASAAHADPTFKAFDLRIQQTELFGYPSKSSLLLQGSLSDTIRGALLQTTQLRKPAKRNQGKLSVSGGMGNLPRLEAAESGQVLQAPVIFEATIQDSALMPRSEDVEPIVPADDSVLRADIEQSSPMIQFDLRLDENTMPLLRAAVQTEDIQPLGAGTSEVEPISIAKPLEEPSALRASEDDGTPSLCTSSNEVASAPPIAVAESVVPIQAQSANNIVPCLIAKQETAVNLLPRDEFAGPITPLHQDTGNLSVDVATDVAGNLLAAAPADIQPLCSEQADEIIPSIAAAEVMPKLLTKDHDAPPLVAPSSVKHTQSALSGTLRTQTQHDSPTVHPLSAQRNTGSRTTAKEIISWDQWYERVGKLCDQRVIKALTEHDNPTGYCDVQLSVRHDGEVGVVLIDGEGDSFVSAVMEAYRGMSGDPLLRFPAKSRAKLKSFVVKNRQAEEGPVTEIDAKRIKGDVEYVDAAKQ